MNISNKELELLLGIEKYLWNDVYNDEKGFSLYLQLYQLNEKLVKAKELRNKKAKNRVAMKRQDNKMYARSKKEILQHEKAIKRNKER